MLESEFLSLFEPFLITIVVFSQKMSPDFMVHYSFNSIFGISDGQPDYDGTYWINIVMYHTCSWDSILCELIGKNICYSKFIDILFESLGSLVNC